MLPATSCTSGNASRSCETVLQHPFAVPVSGVHDQDVHPRGDQAAGTHRGICAAANRRGHPEPAVLILVGVGMLPPLEDVPDRDESLQHALAIHDRQLLDPVRASIRSASSRLVPTGAVTRFSLASSPHESADRDCARTADRDS